MRRIIRQPLSSFAPLLLAAAGLAGCGTLASASPPPQGPLSGELGTMEPNAPAWLTQGCSAFPGEGRPLVCGVGAMSGTRNPSMALDAARGRGRVEIARTLQVGIRALLRGYQAATTDFERLGDEQHLTDTSMQLTHMVLSGTSHQGTWMSPRGTVYALMVLDVDVFHRAISQAKNLPERVRQHIIERAEESFRELDEEVRRSEQDENAAGRPRP